MSEDKSWKKWRMKGVAVGDDVIYYKNMDMGGGLLAKVTAVNGNTVDVVRFQHGQTQERVSLHRIDDPGLKIHASHWIEKDGGVFELAPVTKRLHTALEKVATLEEMVAALALKVEDLAGNKPAQQERKKPGRPKKLVETAVDAENIVAPIVEQPEPVSA